MARQPPPYAPPPKHLYYNGGSTSRAGTGPAASSAAFWNCAAASTSCTDGPMRIDGADYREDLADEDDSIIEHHHPRPPNSSQPILSGRNASRLPPPHMLPPHQRMRSIMDGFLTPFINCVQPPLNACVAPAVDDYETTEAAAVSSPDRKGLDNMRYFSPPRTPAPASTPTSPPNRSGMSSRTNGLLSGAVCFNGNLSGVSTTPPRPLKSQQQLQHPTKPSPVTTRMVPNENDILCGRGGNSNRHPGNIFFRDLIAANKAQYVCRTKKEKMMLARQIVDLVLHHTDPPARFLGRDTSTGLWYDIGVPRSLEKTSQALREKSAAAKAAEKNGGMILASASAGASFDGNESSIFSEATEGVEVVPGSDAGDDESQTTAAAIAALCRASTAKVTNHRNIPIAPPTVIIPGHLQTIYKSLVQPPSISPGTSSIIRDVPVSGYPNHHPIYPHKHHQHQGAPPMSVDVYHKRAVAAASALEQKHSFTEAHRPQQPLSPILPAYQQMPTPEQPHFRDFPSKSDSIEQTYEGSELQRSYPTPAPPPSPISPPRRTSAQHSPFRNGFPVASAPSANAAALVTPSGGYDAALAHSESAANAMAMQSLAFRGAKESSSSAMPIFPLDVFKNPDYGYRSEANIHQMLRNSQSSDRNIPSHERPLHNPDGSLSPTREQEAKRQRRTGAAADSKENLMNTSVESIVELNTSEESNAADLLNLFAKQQPPPQQQGSQQPATGLTEAIALQLTLDDRVIRSPSELTQSLVGGRRRRSPLLMQQSSLPRPTKTSAALDISADSMDGLAALSTAAFLRLDESF